MQRTLWLRIRARRRDRDGVAHHRQLDPASRTMVLLGMGMLSGLIMAVTAVIGLRGADTAAGELTSHALPAEIALQDTHFAASAGERSLLVAIEAQAPVARDAALASAIDAGALQDKSWNTYLSVAVNRTDEEGLRRSYEVSSLSARRLAAALLPPNPTDPTWQAVLATQRSDFDKQLTVLDTLGSTIYEPMARQDAAAINAGIGGGRAAVLVSYLLLGLAFTVVGAVLIRGARRDQRLMRTEKAALQMGAEDAAFQGSLERGLQLAPTEEAAVEIARQALSMVVRDVSTELLLADSSQAHFRQVLSIPGSTDPAADDACRVNAPGDCPAASSGQTQFFGDSTQLDSCPFLRHPGDPVWALCVPVGIAGRSTGVIHAQRPLSDPPPARIATGIELVAQRVGERIGTIRVFAQTQAQAFADPLTGLPNRRRLESQVHALFVPDSPYVVAFADLDHFKAINDVHGHETGDRALRLFARVLRDSIRPRDLLSRHGGEEFVAVLPDCTVADAHTVAERIRSELARTLSRGSLPPFTVTIGLAAAEPGQSLMDVIGRADGAMMQAKALGRDRVLAAGEVPTLTGAGVG